MSLFKEELPIARRSAENVALAVKAKRMYLHIKPSAFKVEEGDIIRLKPDFAVADTHADSIDQVIAVCFNDQLLTTSSEITKEGTKGCLGTWMEMSFWLLPK